MLSGQNGEVSLFLSELMFLVITVGVSGCEQTLLINVISKFVIDNCM